jgi:hypothetical protein
MRRKHSRPASVAAVIAGLVACGPCSRDASAPARPGQAQPATGGSGASVDRAAVAARIFDDVVRPEILFPDPAERALYQALPVGDVHGIRAYGFQLKPQPGMDAKRHFHIISVAAAPTGTLPAAGGSVAGPNGAFSERTLRTSDQRYDVRVSEGMLLPDDVKLRAFDLDRAARAITSRYDTLTARH